MINKNISYELKLNIVIHTCSGIFNLGITGYFLLARMTECYIESSLYITNNNETILTCLKRRNSDPVKTNKSELQLDIIDEKSFVSNLEV